MKVIIQLYNIYNIHIWNFLPIKRRKFYGNFNQSVRGEFSLKFVKKINLSEKKGYDLTFPH